MSNMTFRSFVLRFFVVLGSFFPRIVAEDVGLGCKWTELPDIIPDVDAEP